MWSYGGTLWEIFSFGAKPYGKYSTAMALRKVLSGLRLQMPPNMPDVLSQWTQRCFLPENRPTFEAFAQQLRRMTHNPRPLINVAQDAVGGNVTLSLEEIGLSVSGSQASSQPSVDAPLSAPRAPANTNTDDTGDSSSRYLRYVGELTLEAADQAQHNMADLGSIGSHDDDDDDDHVLLREISEV